jgi:hypothetical protein
VAATRVSITLVAVRFVTRYHGGMPHQSQRFPSSVAGIQQLVTFLNAQHRLGYRLVALDRLAVGRSTTPDMLAVIDLVQPAADPPVFDPPYRVAMAPKPTGTAVTWPITGAPYIPVGPTLFNAAVDIVTNDAGLEPQVWRLWTLPMQPFDNDDWVLLLGESDVLASGPVTETRNAGIATLVITPSDTVHMGLTATAVNVGQTGSILNSATHGRLMLMSRNGIVRRIALRNETVANTTIGVQTELNGVTAETLVTLVNGVPLTITTNRAYVAGQLFTVNFRNPDEDNAITLTNFLVTVEFEHQ